MELLSLATLVGLIVGVLLGDHLKALVLALVVKAHNILHALFTSTPPAPPAA